MPPRKAMGSVPPSGNPKVPVPPIKFDDEIETKMTRKSTSKAQSPPRRRSFSDLLTYLFIRFLALYFIFGALFTCGSHPFTFDYSTKDSNAVCRYLAHGKQHLVPIVTPLVHSAHQRIDPYTGPYIKAVKPYTQNVWKRTRPYYRRAQKQSKVVYTNHLEPLRKKAIKRGRSYTEPHVKKFNKQYQKQVQPYVDNLNRAVKPYQDIYDRDISPYLSQAYAHSLAAGETSYAFYIGQVHPRLVKSLQQLQSFYIYHVDPAMRRTYSLYVRPQVEKIMAKLFERKAHATGSEAISEAKQEVKKVEKESKARSEQAQEEAVKEASRKKNDPSIVEKAKQATESFLGMADDADDEEVARLDAELDAEAEKVKEQLEAWESGMSSLMVQEYKLFTERIADLRNRRLADLPDHFASLTETYVEDEVAAVLARLERVYKKLGKSDMSISDQISSANKQHDAQKAKLIQSEESLEKQIGSYSQVLISDEIKSLEASVGEIRRYVVEAGRSYNRIMEEAKFEKTVDDYDGWDGGMMQRANMIEKDMRNLLEGGKVQSGMDAVDLRKEPKLDVHIADLQSRVKELYSTANSQVDSYVTKGNLQLRGEGVLGAISDATDAVADQAKILSEGAAALMLDSALAARKKIGLGPKETPGILERIQQNVQQATESVASAVGAKPTPKSAGEYVESYVDSATSLAASAVGYETEPDSFIEIIGDGANDILKSAASTASDLSNGAASVYDEATSSVNKAASKVSGGFIAATTSAGNNANNIVNTLPIDVAGEKATKSIVEIASEAKSSVSQSASKFTESAGASGFSILDQVTGGVVETASKGVHQGSQSAHDIYESVKDSVEGAGEAIKEAVVGATTGEDSKLVGKPPKDKDFNTVGKAADAIKEKIVHAEL